MRSRILSSTFAALLLAACTIDEVGSEGEETETGSEPAEGVRLIAETEAGVDLCTSGAGTVEFATRRVDCWDPPLPCTVAQNPPWIVGTSRSCAELESGEAARWEVSVAQTGRWQTRLQSGGSIACFGLDGDARTKVSREDLDKGAEFMLAPVSAGQCGDP